MIKNINMKTYKLPFIILLLSIFSSCLPDEEINPDSDDPRDNIEYTWTCNENSPTYGELTYMVDISKDPYDSTKVILSNFYQLGTWSTTKATLSGKTLTISSQTVDGHTISGQGTIESNYKTINWTYEVVELNYWDKVLAKENVTAVFTR